MRVLFVPNETVVIPHGIPLLALNQQCQDQRFETAFLLPRGYHSIRRPLDINILNIDYNGFRSEMQAYGEFRPDVVVDDCSLRTGHAAALSGLPRVTILRTGTFPGYVPGNPLHRHSMGFTANLNLPDITWMGLKQPHRIDEMFVASQHIIPGIPSVELLTAACIDNPDYSFSGPLMLSDLQIEELERVVRFARHEFISRLALERFVARNSSRPLIYVTFGNVAQAKAEIHECIRSWLNMGIGVISNVKLDHLSAAQLELYYYSMYFPMHYVCSHIKAMVHHCGSGTYHYPLLHSVPCVTVGTGCFDRDDVAVRLQELGVSLHVADPAEEPAFKEKLMKAVETQLGLSGQNLGDYHARVSALQEEIQQVSNAFSFDQLLDRAVASKLSLSASLS